MPWVGVAAALHLGEPNVEDLIAALRDSLAAPRRSDRNALRGSEKRLVSSQQRNRSSSVGPASPATGESRVALQRVRLGLLRFIRDECASMRAELRDAAAAIPAGGAGRFETRVRDDAARFLADLDEEMTRAVSELALDHVAGDQAGLVGEPAPPEIAGPPSASRCLETRLMAVLGAGFGLGIALASNRLFSGLAPGLSIAGWVAGCLIGSALVVWVVRTRGVLSERALLDRWVAEVAATLRWHGEARVAERLLAVEWAQSAARRRGSRQAPREWRF